MSKRSADDKIERYKAKIRKLEEKQYRKRIRIIDSSDSEEKSGKLELPLSIPISRGGEGGTEEDGASGPSGGPPSCIAVPVEAIVPEQPTACSHAPTVEISPPAAPEPYPGGREALRIAFLRRNTPPVALDLMLSSISSNTLKQYSVSFKLWWEFCVHNS
ncbi:unnamed protein product [Plutella xylostella]|uniref:(diamondback moth) hypothetical protein n=1 Tax=Plutella xylostella TaxID=51655 RepID=A0A8S4G8L4_PLUXY|nr:unnamed protein product [Plutella xylostella]